MTSPTMDINPADLAIVLQILSRHVPDREVAVFGSRATWTAHKASDLDVAILGDTPVPGSTLARLKEEFDESRLPFSVDVIDWATTKDSFKRVVERDLIRIESGRDMLRSR